MSIHSAPSNIALIKYMGKTNAQSNLPTNPSLSYTLDHLRTYVRLKISEDAEDQWQPLEGYPELKLSEKGKTKFLKHFRMLKSIWNIDKNYMIASANNFAADAGLASSASSFAALTMAAANEFQKIKPLEKMPDLSEISRQGSGSSCRSFFSPWGEWDAHGARKFESPWSGLLHDVILVSEEKKEVSSSDAHLRVLGSPLFKGRIERVTERFVQLKKLLQHKEVQNWKLMFDIVWDEFIDMHELFETSEVPFSYMNQESRCHLEFLKSYWKSHGDGPLVTMDAGPNIHLLYRPDQEVIRQAIKQKIAERSARMRA